MSPESTVRIEDVLPDTAKKVEEATPEFRSFTKLPRHTNKYLVIRAVERLVRGEPETKVLFGLTATEKETIKAIVAEHAEYEKGPLAYFEKHEAAETHAIGQAEPSPGV